MPDNDADDERDHKPLRSRLRAEIENLLADRGGWLNDLHVSSPSQWQYDHDENDEESGEQLSTHSQVAIFPSG